MALEFQERPELMDSVLEVSMHSCAHGEVTQESC